MEDKVANEELPPSQFSFCQGAREESSNVSCRLEQNFNSFSASTVRPSVIALPESNMISREQADWSLLPSHLLITIVEKLFVTDIIHLHAVCTAWAWSLGRPRKGWPKPHRYRASFIPIPPSVPWMLLPNQNNENADSCCFLDLSDGKIRQIFPIPEMVGRRCVGASPDGWLVTLDLELNPRVLNPLTREELPLPSLLTLFPYHTNVRFPHDHSDGSLIGYIRDDSYYCKDLFRDKYFLKIVLTSAPPFGVAAVLFGIGFNTRLAFSRVGDASWTPVLLSGKSCYMPNMIEDVMYHKEDRRLYAWNFRYMMFFDLDIIDWLSGLTISPTPLPMKPTIITKINHDFSTPEGQKHLISLSGRLLQIREDYYYEWEAERLRQVLALEDEDEDVVMSKTCGIEITKLDPMMNQPGMAHSWIPANASDLDDQAIFIGYNHAFSVPVAGKPGLKKNAIYFTQMTKYDYLPSRRHVHDAGVFDVETGVFQRFFPSDSLVNCPPPVWFMPCQLHLELLS